MNGSVTDRFEIFTLPTFGKISLSSTFDTWIDSTEQLFTFDTPIYYKGDLNYFGTDSFEYKVRDASGLNSATATLAQINVLAVDNDPLIASENYSLTVTKEKRLLIILRKGTDVDDVSGSSSITTFKLTQLPTNGLLSANTNFISSLELNVPYDITTAIYYRGNINYVGADTFIYKVRDTVGLDSSGSTSVTVNVTDVNIDAPIAPVGITIDGSPYTVNILSIPSGTDPTNGSTPPYFTLTKLPTDVIIYPSDYSTPSLQLGTQYSFSSSYYFYSFPISNVDTFEYEVVGSTGLISDNSTIITINIISNSDY